MVSAQCFAVAILVAVVALPGCGTSPESVARPILGEIDAALEEFASVDATLAAVVSALPTGTVDESAAGAASVSVQDAIMVAAMQEDALATAVEAAREYREIHLDGGK